MLKAYFGFMILMGLNQLPTLFDYWRLNVIYHYSPIASHISRKQFLDISRYLHYANNEDRLTQTLITLVKFDQLLTVML